MSNNRLLITLVPLVLGLGAATHVNAGQHDIEQSLNQSIQEQSERVSQQLATELSQSIQMQLRSAKPNRFPITLSTAYTNSTLTAKTESQSE